MEKFTIFTDDQVQAARFAKAMGHPVRIYILQLLSQQSCCLQRRPYRHFTHRKIDSFTTF